MALYPIQPGLNPLGQFDLLDTALASITGGEVMTLAAASTSNSATEKAAYDALDGYVYDASGTLSNRAVAKLATSAEVNGFLALADDGLAGYGTMFGQPIGTSAGLTVSATDLGPNTAAASGKVTLWDKAGLYEVTVNSCASDFVSTIPAAGLTPGLTTLGFNASSKLSHRDCSGAVASSAVGYFVEFAPSGSLVTTPHRLLSGSTLTQLYPRVVLSFHAGLGTRTLV